VKYEKTFLMIKPDAIGRQLIGKIISQIEDKGLKIVGMKMIKVSDELAKQQYAEHVGKPFYNGLLKYITTLPVIVMVISGKNAIQVIRKLVGKTNPLEAEITSLRGRYCQEIGRNLVHAADSPEAAKREISLFFNENEIFEYETVHERWLYEED
jgi:nucleoside-diphosphate kinase